MKLVKFLLQFVIASLIIYGIFLSIGTLQDWESVWSYKSLFFQGWLVTILLSIAALLGSVLVGCLGFLGSQSSVFLIRKLFKCYIEIIRGTPLLVQILFFYYVVAHNIGIENRYLSSIIILSLFNGAYISEMIRAGIEGVGQTQRESAKAIGLSNFQAYRFVIIPQAIRHIIPPLTGQFASIIKDTSLLSVIGINEVTNSAQQINSVTYSTLESFLPLAIAYLILTLPISLLSKKLEEKFHYEN